MYIKPKTEQRPHIQYVYNVIILLSVKEVDSHVYKAISEQRPHIQYVYDVIILLSVKAVDGHMYKAQNRAETSYPVCLRCNNSFFS